MYRIDERFTSKIAKQTIAISGAPKMKRRNKENIDKISATLILQSYLNKNLKHNPLKYLINQSQTKLIKMI